MHKNAEFTHATWQQPTVRRLSAVSASEIGQNDGAFEGPGDDEQYVSAPVS